MSIAVEEIINMICNNNISKDHLMDIIENNISSENINYFNDRCGSLLTVAILCNCRDIAKLLIDKGADVNKSCGRYSTPLASAAASGDEYIVEYLINKGANIEGTNITGYTPFMSASSIRIIKILMENGANINANCNGCNTLDFAIDENDLEIVKFLTSIKNFTISENNLNMLKNCENKKIVDLVTTAFNNQKDIKFAGRKV